MAIGTSCELRLTLLLKTQASLAYHLEPESWWWLWGQERPQPCRRGDICLSPLRSYASGIVDICGLSDLVARNDASGRIRTTLDRYPLKVDLTRTIPA